jgi:hypothetical protein
VPGAELQASFTARLGVLQRHLSSRTNCEASVDDFLRISKQVFDLRDEVLGATRAGAA